jgi:uncharacterized peroxidase-related enzyme
MPQEPQPPVSRYPVPTLDAMPEDIRARILKVQEKSGFIPNVFLMLAYRPDEFRAFMAYHDALMDKPSGLTQAEREMIVVATSAANQCQYCIIAHGAILRVQMRSSMCLAAAVNGQVCKLRHRLRIIKTECDRGQLWVTAVML